jgi:uncharacterized membrane protein YphA (DoxX/SURF4 family)
MDVVFLIGRILFALVFLSSGPTLHLLQREKGIGYARAYGAPAPEVMVPLSGLAITLGALSVAFGVWGDLGALVLVAFLLPTAFYMHAFWKEQDEQMQQNQMAHFMKNVALAGGALALFYAWNQLQGEAGLSLTDPLFDRAD